MRCWRPLSARQRQPAQTPRDFDCAPWPRSRCSAQALEPVVAPHPQLDHAVAVVADQVVVVVARREHRLAALDRAADVERSTSPVLGEQLERPVDGREPDAPALVRSRSKISCAGGSVRARASSSARTPTRCDVGRSPCGQQFRAACSRVADRPISTARLTPAGMRIVLILAARRARLRRPAAARRPTPPGPAGTRRSFAGFYPLACAAERVGGDDRRRAQPDARRAPSRTTSSSRRATSSASAPRTSSSTSARASSRRSRTRGRRDAERPSISSTLRPARRRAPRTERRRERSIRTSGSTRCAYAAIVERIGARSSGPAPAGALVAELATLDGEFRRGLARCERRELVTSHAAFGYLADRYGLEQIPITGVSPEAEPTAARPRGRRRRRCASTARRRSSSRRSSRRGSPRRSRARSAPRRRC